MSLTVRSRSSHLQTNQNQKLTSNPVYLLIWNKPVATSPWNQEQEGADAANWAQGFVDVWKSPLPILAAGSYGVPFQPYPGWPNTEYLISTAYNKTIKDATKFYNSHLYRQGNGTTLPNEMNHASTVSDVIPFINSVAKAQAVHRPHVIGEILALLQTITFLNFESSRWRKG